jgi:hypothetical protein
VPTTPICATGGDWRDGDCVMGGERILIGADGRRTPAWYLAGTSYA